MYRECYKGLLDFVFSAQSFGIVHWVSLFTQLHGLYLNHFHALCVFFLLEESAFLLHPPLQDNKMTWSMFLSDFYLLIPERQRKS